MTKPARSLNPRMSMQKLEVSAVNAPSALGKRADISPMMNRMDTAFGMACRARVGKRSSPITLSALPSTLYMR